MRIKALAVSTAAVAVLSVSTASAVAFTEFKAEKAVAGSVAGAGGTQTITIEGASETVLTYKCLSVTSSGAVYKSFESGLGVTGLASLSGKYLSMTPKFANCSKSGFQTTVENHGCQYSFAIGGTVSIDPAGCTIAITQGRCTTSIQGGSVDEALKVVEYADVNRPKYESSVSVRTAGMTATVSGESCAIPPGTYKTVTYNGSLALSGAIVN